MIIIIFDREKRMRKGHMSKFLSFTLNKNHKSITLSPSLDIYSLNCYLKFIYQIKEKWFYSGRAVSV